MNAKEKKALGAKVRAARKARGMDQQELADAAGVSLGSISNLERGVTVPQPANRRTIACALGEDVFGDGIAQDTRDSWPDDVKVFTDVLGQALAVLPEAQRAERISRWMGDIFQLRGEV